MDPRKSHEPAQLFPVGTVTVSNASLLPNAVRDHHRSGRPHPGPDRHAALRRLVPRAAHRSRCAAASSPRPCCLIFRWCWDGRSDGRVFAMRDSCPHRGIPLSEGWFDGNHVTCRYHGWEFEPCSGQCALIPSLSSHDHLDATRIYATAFPCEERDGHAWVYIPGPGSGRSVTAGREACARAGQVRPALPHRIPHRRPALQCRSRHHRPDGPRAWPLCSSGVVVAHRAPASAKRPSASSPSPKASA